MQECIDCEIDTTLFILYDKNENYYVVTGERSQVCGKPLPVSYKFYCKFPAQLFDFISIVICEKSKINYTLYNYNDLPEYSQNIDYQYLKKLLDNNSGYELAGYDNKNFNKEEILKYLNMLKNVFNYY
jgi:hypothetical protein